MVAPLGDNTPLSQISLGWVCEPELINAEKRWYNHRYVNVADPSITADQAPPGTRSFLQKLAADPQTAHFVGVPTVFLSHAWTYKFRNVITAIRNYVEALPARAPQPFFWFDCFSIDEHATQSLTQGWWSTTFQDAIRDIGATLMVLSPWDNPLPLTRAWCLWELFSTHKVDATFHICLGPEEQRAFEHAITHDAHAWSCRPLLRTSTSRRGGIDFHRNFLAHPDIIPHGQNL
eukprot:COSAG05_NODE_403_length_10204_cov_874.669372_6_plen_233_part_00